MFITRMIGVRVFGVLAGLALVCSGAVRAQVPTTILNA